MGTPCLRPPEAAVGLWRAYLEPDRDPVAQSPAMTRNEFHQMIADLTAIDRFHQAMTPAHLSHGCAFCQSLNERQDDLMRRWAEPSPAR